MTHFPEHMVFMIFSGVGDNSSHFAKRRLFRRQIAASLLAEVAVHVQVSTQPCFQGCVVL